MKNSRAARQWFLVALCGLLFTLTGCGRSQEASEEVLMWLVGSESQAKVIQALGDGFFKEKAVTFRCEAISWGDAHTKYLTSIAGGVVPDIGTMGFTWGTEFGSLGATVDLAKEFPDDIRRIAERNFIGLWDSVDYKGHVYGIPFDVSLQIMFYRKDMVAAPPRTWRELENLLVDLKGKGKGMIFDWGSMSWIGYAPFLWQAGGDFFDAQGQRCSLDSDAAAEGLRFFASLYREYGVPKTQIPLEQGMRTADFPLAISGNWKIDSLRLSAPEIAGKWSIGMLPAGPSGKRTVFMGGRILGIFSISKHKKEAWEFIQFLFEPATQVKLYEAARSAQDSYLPSNKDAWNSLPIESEFKEVLKAQALDGQGPPSVLGWDEGTRFIEEAIQRAVLQGADIKTELAAVARKVEQQIARKQAR